MTDPSTTGRRPRVALYGHDTCGLGHLRRNLALAAAMRSSRTRPDVLLISGSPAAQRFPLPDGVDLVVLPSVRKDAEGGYRAGALEVPLADVVSIRSAAATAVLAAWQPDLLVVDKAPRGFQGELVDALEALDRTGGTRVVLGLRDVLDAPAVTRSEWRRDGGSQSLERWYDEVWVYGDAVVHDLRAELRLSADRTRFLGYLADGRRDADAAGMPRRDLVARTVLASVGGGSDGAGLTRTLLSTPLPPGVELVLLPGPFADTSVHADLARAARDRTDLHVVPFSDALADWAQSADAVICMGGYNSVAEVLATDTPALVVPRTRPRREQLVRARAMARRGLVEVAENPDPTAVAAWIARALSGSVPHSRTGVALDGLDAVRRRTDELLAQPSSRSETCRAS